jgi:uncharacterized protein (DUF342 family)
MDKNNKSTKIRSQNTSSVEEVYNTNDINNVEDHELPNLIKQFISTQTNILDLKKQIKLHNMQYKILQQKIIQFMNSNQLQNIDTQQNIISIRSTNIKQHINMSLLSNYFNKKHGVSIETIESFMDQVPTKTQNTLIIKPK